MLELDCLHNVRVGCLNDVGMELIGFTLLKAMKIRLVLVRDETNQRFMIKLGQNRVRSRWASCVDCRINVNHAIMSLIRDDYEYKEEMINGVLDIVKREEGERGGN